MLYAGARVLGHCMGQSESFDLPLCPTGHSRISYIVPSVGLSWQAYVMYLMTSGSLPDTGDLRGASCGVLCGQASINF